MSFVVLFFCSFCFFSVVSHAAVLEGNPNPCMRAKHNNAHNVFLKRHLPDGVPRTWDQNAWENMLRNIKTCARPTQSFFRASDSERVNRVCTKTGGKALSGNLCVSKEKFTFVTVRVDVGEGTCGIRTMRNETKHIILACDQIGEGCLPVHFEANPKSLGPENNQADCGSGSGSGGNSGVKAAGHRHLLLFTLLVLAYVY